MSVCHLPLARVTFETFLSEFNYNSIKEFRHKLSFNGFLVVWVRNGSFLENSVPNLTFFAEHFLRFVRAFSHGDDAGVVEAIWESFKHGMFFQLFNLPVVEVLDICHDVNFSTILQNVSVIGQQCRVDDATAFVAVLEMGVSKAKEHFFNLHIRSNQRLTEFLGK